MSNINAEVAALKAQLAAVMTAVEGKGIDISMPSVWVVHNPHKRSVWCSKSDCAMLGRKSTYDVVKESIDPEAEDLIMTGVSQEASEESDVKRKVKRVGAPTIKLDDLGVIAAFSSKTKAVDFMDNYFKLNQNSIVGNGDQELQMTEVKVTS